MFIFHLLLNISRDKFKKKKALIADIQRFVFSVLLARKLSYWTPSDYKENLY